MTKFGSDPKNGGHPHFGVWTQIWSQIQIRTDPQNQPDPQTQIQIWIQIRADPPHPPDLEIWKIRKNRKNPKFRIFRIFRFFRNFSKFSKFRKISQKSQKSRFLRFFRKNGRKRAIFRCFFENVTSPSLRRFITRHRTAALYTSCETPAMRSRRLFTQPRNAFHPPTGLVRTHCVLPGSWECCA